MVTRNRRLLLAVVAVSATGTALTACSSSSNIPPGCGFNACGASAWPIDASATDAPQHDGSATDAHAANDAPSE